MMQYQKETIGNRVVATRRKGCPMDLLKEKVYTSEDYWNLPEGHRAELIDGQFYNMAPPNYVHQKLLSEPHHRLMGYVKKQQGECEIIPAPFAVNLNADDERWVEPDISVICDKSKLTDRGCDGAPDFIVEIVSPGSRKMDYGTKMVLYMEAGVREYWIVDPAKKCTAVYRFEEDVAPILFPFDRDIVVGIYGDLSVNIADLMK